VFLGFKHVFVLTKKKHILVGLNSIIFKSITQKWIIFGYFWLNSQAPEKAWLCCVQFSPGSGDKPKK